MEFLNFLDSLGSGLRESSSGLSALRYPLETYWDMYSIIKQIPV